MQLEFDHVHLRSPNPEATVAWYCDILGANILSQGELLGAHVFTLDLAGIKVNIFGPRPEETLRPASLDLRFGLDHFGFQVRDINEVVSYLKEKGVTITQEPKSINETTHIAFFQGPDQVRIELCQRD